MKYLLWYFLLSYALSTGIRLGFLAAAKYPRVKKPIERHVEVIALVIEAGVLIWTWHVLFAGGAS